MDIAITFGGRGLKSDIAIEEDLLDGEIRYAIVGKFKKSVFEALESTDHVASIDGIAIQSVSHGMELLAKGRTRGNMIMSILRLPTASKKR
uniref:Uncharacterized protein n=1 Tax=Panagrolaimus sp. ES5 TaxID=591445 RepID=A0AC34G8S8_9BILA